MTDQEKIWDVLQQLLYAIYDGDADTYKQLVDENLTCFEPETHGHPVDGLPFHLFLINNTVKPSAYHFEIVRPIIRVYGTTAYAAYTLLLTVTNPSGPVVSQVNETRIFSKTNGSWKMVHFHRS